MVARTNPLEPHLGDRIKERLQAVWKRTSIHETKDDL